MRLLLPWYVMVACYGIIDSIVTAIFPGYANSVGTVAILVGVNFEAIFTGYEISRVVAFATSEHYPRFGEVKALMYVAIA